MNPYKVLDVEPDASKEEIRLAYRRKAKEFHPDVNKSKGAPLRFKRINRAYQMIKDAPPPEQVISHQEPPKPKPARTPDKPEKKDLTPEEIRKREEKLAKKRADREREEELLRKCLERERKEEMKKMWQGILLPDTIGGTIGLVIAIFIFMSLLSSLGNLF